MRPQFRLRSLFSLLTAFAVAIGLLRGIISEPEPYWGFYLISLASVAAGIAAVIITAFDPRGSNT